jgi:hypothetical protein
MDETIWDIKLVPIRINDRFFRSHNKMEFFDQLLKEDPGPSGSDPFK